MENAYESKLAKLKEQDRQARRAALDYWYALGALVLDLKVHRRAHGGRTIHDLGKDMRLSVEDLLCAKAFYITFSNQEIDQLIDQRLGWEHVRILVFESYTRFRDVDQKEMAEGKRSPTDGVLHHSQEMIQKRLAKIERMKKVALRVQRRNAGIPLTPRKSRKRRNNAEAVA